MGSFVAADRHPESGLTCATAQPLALAHAGDRDRPAATLQSAETRDGLGSTDLVAHQAGVALELADGLLGHGTEDAVDTPGVEPERAEPQLQLRDVVAAHHGRTQAEEPVAELVLRLDEGGPRRRVARPVVVEAPVALEPAHGVGGRVVEHAVDPSRLVADRTEAPLQVRDVATARSGAQRERSDSDGSTSGESDRRCPIRLTTAEDDSSPGTEQVFDPWACGRCRGRVGQR